MVGIHCTAVVLVGHTMFANGDDPVNPVNMGVEVIHAVQRGRLPHLRSSAQTEIVYHSPFVFADDMTHKRQHASRASSSEISDFSDPALFH